MLISALQTLGEINEMALMMLWPIFDLLLSFPIKPVKLLVCVLVFRGVSLEQAELAHHPLWHVKLDCPMANQWTTH